jgi:hypothetical protein
MDSGGRKMKKTALDDEEKDILASYDRGECGPGKIKKVNKKTR